MFINEARVSTDKNGVVTELKKETVDRLASLCGLRGPHAQVGIYMGTSFNYGEMKIDVSVTLTCDQNEDAMDQAAKLSIEKGLEFLNLGLEAHHLQTVQYDTTPLWEISEKPTDKSFAELSSGRGPIAHVGVNVGTSIGYGEIKLKASLRLACDQTTERVDRAAALAISKTNEFVHWGLSAYKRG